VANEGAPHGGAFLYRANDGKLYTGGAPYPMRSTDNGVSWEQLKSGTTYAAYYSVIGDGNFLYTSKSCPCNGDPDAAPGEFADPYLVSPERDGLNWTKYEGGAQKFLNGPYTMAFDPIHRIIYSANWVAGVWALKVKEP
jgi:hypothetical protein